MPQISVIIPVYKCEEYIEVCVDSILNQTFSDFEIILVDDGSPDNSGKICNELAQKHEDKIRVLHQPNFGQAVARNAGTILARGEWLHFVDSDDTLHPEMLQRLYDAVTENNVKLAMCSAVQGDKLPEDFNNPKKVSFNALKMTEDNILNLCKNKKYYYWVVWGKLIHKSIFKKYPFTESKIYEDNAVVCKWLHEAETVAITDAPLYFYFVNTAGTTKKAFSDKQIDILWAFKEQIDFFHSLGYKKMTEYLVAYYFEIYANTYYRAKNGYSKYLIPRIKKHKKDIKKKYSKYIKLNAQQQLYYYEKTNMPMFYITRLKKKLGLLK